MVYGTPQEKNTIVDMVHHVHDLVHGPGYNAHDPELQLWVAATLYACGVTTYERIFGKLSEDTAEKVYCEYAILATSLRMPPGMWPKDRVAFWAYWDEKIESFEITPQAINVCNNLLWNNKAPLWLRMNLPIIRVLTAEWLPPRIRQAYGLKASRSRRAIYRVSMGSTKAVYPHLPVFLREWPLRHYMTDIRKRMKKSGEV